MRRLAGTFAIGAVGVLLLGVWRPAWVGAGVLAAAVNGSNIVWGCLLLALLTPLISGRWQMLLAPGSRLGSGAVLLIVPMLVPVLLAMNWLYPWFHLDTPGFRGLWLSPWFFVLRTLLYAGLALALLGWSQRPDAERSGPGLILYGLVVSLAAVDWLMSLQSEFVSSLFGVLLIARQLLDGLAFAGLCVLCWNLVPLPAPQRQVLRGLLISALAFWAYVHFMQYLIIWSVNLQDETQWYRVRQAGVWGALSGLLMAGQVMCLLALASPWGARSKVLIWGCSAILLLGSVESIWMSLPSIFPDVEIGAGLMAVLCQGIYGLGLWAWWRWQWQRRRHEV
ncbi:hypothetical protein FHW68_003753 [Pseudomonas sp. Tn43]|uniref:hypothetical protein n=1 Tax=unclassified Pseudomonas TaxID=196821 RepID=UPI000BAC01B3|nr:MULTISPECIES: hypothetical protein [unclassified Pseudomonas]MBB3242216.1 hypothetical protein [Pseudomonas sp. Tn43]PAU61911.1 hypothetical protein BZL43_04115 [Pseudomonas sp. PICF141]